MIAMRLAVPVVALAVAAVAAVPDRRPARLRLSVARGALELVNSRDGQAAFDAPNMKPGDTAAGSLRVTNRGTSEARLFLRSAVPEGGSLADVLRVRVAEGSATVATGSFEEIAGCHDLGILARGSKRTFRFTATWPPASHDNAYAGSTVRADEHWFANEDGNGCVAGEEPAVAEHEVAGAVQLSASTRIVISHRRVALVRGHARVRLRCLGRRDAKCVGSIRLRPRGARTRFRIPAGRSRTVYVRVPWPLRRQRKAGALAVVENAARTMRTTRALTLISRRR